jgi:hypothetical protein
LFEEIKPTMVEPLKGTDSFAEAELANGDIICVQKPPPGNATLPRPLAPAHYAWMLNRYHPPPRTTAMAAANRLSLSLSGLWSLVSDLRVCRCVCRCVCRRVSSCVSCVCVVGGGCVG